MNKPERRVDEIIADLLRGRPLRLRGGDAEEKAAITAAARLAGTRQGPQRMHPAFRKRLAAALETRPREGWMTRRAALVAGLGLAGGTLGGVLFGKSLEPQIVEPPLLRSGGQPIQPVNGRWVDVGAVSDLVEGEGKHVVAGGVGAYLFRSGDKVSAVSSICSHLPCELSWHSAGGNLVCTCHPAKFTPDGHPTDPYSLPALNTVGVRVTAAGRIEVLGTA
jgi:nitrite reductase/ring-hydroxylating ferredoxin subunit